jgi:hypothetical protein
VTTRGRRVVVAVVLRRVGRVVLRAVVSPVVVVVALIAGGGPTAGTATGGGTASIAGGAAATVSIGVAPVATPTPRTPATALDTPSVERASTRGHVRARGAGGRSAVVGPATVTASSSLVTSG